MRDESPVRTPGPDRVTSNLLRGREVRLPEEEDYTRWASRVRTADSIRQRLDNMNEQFTVIQHMSDNMEHDFKNTKLVGYLRLYNTPPSIQHYLPLYNIPSSIQHYLPLYNTSDNMEHNFKNTKLVGYLLLCNIPPSMQHTSLYTTYLSLCNTTSLCTTLSPSIKHV